MSWLRETRNRNAILFYLAVSIGGIIANLAVNWHQYDQIRYVYGEHGVRIVITSTVSLLVLIIVFGGVLVYILSMREREYKQAIEIIDEFGREEFEHHLPKNKEGTFYRLLSKVDSLSLNLKGRVEAETQVHELVNSRIADISHQLKTPITALLMYNEIMEQEPVNPETISEFNAKSKNALVRMERLITMLLVMTRIDAGAITFEKERYYVRELVEESVLELQQRAKSENKIIQLVGDDTCRIFCDKKWTMEAIGNLVKNSLDHMEAQTQVTITWNENPNMTRIEVTDQGTGISEEDSYHIFKRFYRSKSDKSPGVGLGLPLTKSIIEEQGGSIHMESRLGEGTTFTISL